MTSRPEARRAYPSGATITTQHMADGWPVRVFDWPVQTPRGRILFQGGRGDIIEKYLEAFTHWNAIGWSVTAFDWRGQGGSGRLLEDPMVGHSPGFDVWIDDLAQFWDRRAAHSKGPHVVIGHSMGGHLILRALAEKRIAPNGAVLVAPMLGFETAMLPVGLVAAIVGVVARGRFGERLAWKTNERPAAAHASRAGFLTHDADRYADELWWKTEKPELALGPPSIKWLADAYRSAVTLRDMDLSNIATPVLALGTWGDKLVSPQAIADIVPRIPGAGLHMFGSEVAHEILREIDSVRGDALARVDAFLQNVAV
jgi:lysophospholipase